MTVGGLTRTGLIAGVGYITFDRNGNATQEECVVKNGTEASGGMKNASDFHTGKIASYTIDDDCSGTLNMTLGPGTIRTDPIAVSPRCAAMHAVVSQPTTAVYSIRLQGCVDFENVNAAK